MGSMAVTDATFKSEVLDATVPVLVDFWAPWCGPCRMVGPIIESVAEKMVGKAKVFKLNTDENNETATKYGITGIPTVMIFNKGQVVSSLVGVRQEAEYIRNLEKA